MVLLCPCSPTSAVEDLLGDGDCGHGLGSARVEGEVGDGLGELGLLTPFS